MSVLFATTYPERTSHLILLGGFPQGGYNVSDEAFEPYVEKVLANWGTGQMMKRVVGATGEKWDDIVIVRYVSLSALRRILESPEYETHAAPHRRAALADWKFIVTTQPVLTQ